MRKLVITLLILFTVATAHSQATLSALQKEGNDFYKQGKTTDAIASFKKALAENPKNLYSMNALGNLYLMNGNYQEAYSIANEGIKLSNGSPNFIVVKAKTAIKINKAQEAVTIIDNYLKTHQPDFMILFVKGTASNVLNDMQQALSSFSASIAANPNFPDAYLARGKGFATIERWPLALQDYTKYISLIDDDPEGYAVRGVAYYRTSKPDEAIADYSKALQLDPKQLFALNNRGIVYRERKQTDKALADFNAAIAMSPNYADPYYESAKLYKDLKDFKKALPLVNKAVALQTNYPHFYALQAMILLGDDKNTEALAISEKILEKDNKNSDGYIAKISAYYNMEKFDDALNAASTGIAILPDNYLLYMLRASVYKAKGNTQMANADDAKAKQLAANIK